MREFKQRCNKAPKNEEFDNNGTKLRTLIF